MYLDNDVYLVLFVSLDVIEYVYSKISVENGFLFNMSFQQ